ncbi:Tissue factor pathway inhibitor [Lucilia cuprina]|nr:Tissue factor pathway inhibitor [Lucilia cuprina]
MHIFLLTLALEDFISEICYEEPLLSPKECFGNFTTWSYMNKTNTCEKFIYTGCMGNENRFDSKQECIDACVESLNFIPSATNASNMNIIIFLLPFMFVLTLAQEDFRSDSCFEEPFVTSSECSGSFKAWSYIAKTNSCKEFTYTGCLGNDNRYTSEQECKGMCVVSPNTEDDEEHEGIMFYIFAFLLRIKTVKIATTTAIDEFNTFVGSRIIRPGWNRTTFNKV